MPRGGYRSHKTSPPGRGSYRASNLGFVVTQELHGFAMDPGWMRSDDFDLPHVWVFFIYRKRVPPPASRVARSRSLMSRGLVAGAPYRTCDLGRAGRWCRAACTVGWLGRKHAGDASMRGAVIAQTLCRARGNARGAYTCEKLKSKKASSSSFFFLPPLLFPSLISGSSSTIVSGASFRASFRMLK